MISETIMRRVLKELSNNPNRIQDEVYHGLIIKRIYEEITNQEYSHAKHVSSPIVAEIAEHITTIQGVIEDSYDLSQRLKEDILDRFNNHENWDDKMIEDHITNRMPTEYLEYMDELKEVLLDDLDRAMD